MIQPFKLSPSDLTFLWSDCPRCFYLKVARGLGRPPTAMPAIFQRIDRLMKAFSQGTSTQDISANLPSGTVTFADRWVQSDVIASPNGHAQAFIRGKFDSVAQFDDGRFGVVDFKTTEPKVEHVGFYSRQLRAYAYALEHPAPGKLGLSPISHLGLLSVTPDLMERREDGQVTYRGRMTWQAISANEASFLEFVAEVLTVLEQPDPPPPDPDCVWCRYRDQARASGL